MEHTTPTIITNSNETLLSSCWMEEMKKNPMPIMSMPLSLPSWINKTSSLLAVVPIVVLDNTSTTGTSVVLGSTDGGDDDNKKN
jgi:hypothetical protein